ncbi:DUF1566 domain-containing protein [Desulfobotulus sp.]|jgi:hypothetical protein|uniref:Lcl C-terminal domain-containing protein n=1 Tax=Desulfobotulus sp. TaxID=1940337 RepID=UPI002A3712A4|nr:DUF1566 domain-containing protein [Desulfobotulus sp.]MDY0164674.1 DUF1566 domain-containing protein [Desulfobotulus sp.]
MKNQAIFIPLVFLAALFFSPSLMAGTVCSGSENTAITPTTPTTDFDIHADGTVTHKPTGLMWMRCSLGQTWDGSTCTGSASTHTWQGALQAAEDLNAGGGFAGHRDWRLPGIKELKSIVEERCYEPAIHGSVFPGMSSSWFWSSSPGAYATDDAWSLSFNYGYVYDHYKNYNYQARLVRGGQ